MKCSWCPNEFEPTRSDAKFCSTACRVAHHRANKPKHRQTKFCEYCGGSIPMTQPGQPHRYCSDAHRQAAYRKRNPDAKLLSKLPKMFKNDLQGAFDYCEAKHLEKYGYDWKWRGSKVVRSTNGYFLEPGDRSFKSFEGTYLGKSNERCIAVFVGYVRDGRENAAMRRYA